ncbi:MAG: class I SAM-dependent methyltransferase [Blautia sp.]|nr:class I SAM-dependent methyltransferase [Blautia sp.]MCM1200969.1 class I SAM-dependent methyltransferase [Bacteroides fragilis]
MAKCFICGEEMSLYSNENYDMNSLDSYGFASRKTPEYMHYKLMECKKCGLISSIRTIENEEIYQKYKEADYDSGSEADDASKTYIEYLKKYVPDFPKRKALDIGTGNGSYLSFLLRGGVQQALGVEPSVAPIQKADDKIRKYIINDIFKKDSFIPAEFDMVSCFQTIEHIPDSNKLLNDIRTLLEDNGLVYIVCHNYKSIVNRILGMKSPIYDIEHLQLFSKKSIRKLLEKVGYKRITVFTLRNKYPLKYWIRLFPFPTKMKKSILRILDGTKLAEIRIGINVGNIGIIARK